MRYRPALQIFFFALLIFFLNSTVSAVTIDNLDSVVIQVTDSSIETRTQALPLAFEKVVLRMSSSRKSISHPEYVKAKQKIDSYVKTFFYKESSNVGVYDLTVQFKEQAVADLLNKIGCDGFSKERPQILLWLVLEQDNNQRFITNASKDSKDIVADKIDILSNNYGLPVILPLLDLTERLFIVEQDVINFNVPPLQQAAGRYNPDSIVIGKVQSMDGVWNCEWRLLAEVDSYTSWNSTGNDLDAELESMFNHLSDKVIAKYKNNNQVTPITTISGASNTNISKITVRINGINSVADYAKILSHLKSLNVVRQVEIGGVDGNQAMFVVSSDAGKEAIVKALNKDALLIAESDIDATLIYRVN